MIITIPRWIGHPALILIGGLSLLHARADIPPGFRIGQAGGGNVSLSWSDDDSEWIEWYPETAKDLDGTWQSIKDAPQKVGDRFTLDHGTAGNRRFFRLARSPIFFVDDDSRPTGDGTLANPFPTIALGLNAARQSFIANGRRPVVYVLQGTYPESLSIDAIGITDYRLTLMDSSTRIEFDGMTIGGFGQTAELRPSIGAISLAVDGLASFALLGFDVRSQNANCIEIESVDDAYLVFNALEPYAGDGYHCRNSNLFINFPSIGVFNGDGNDGIEVINDDGLQRSLLIQNGNFGFGLSTETLDGTLEHGIRLNAASGRLDARLLSNFVLSQRETILTTDGGLNRSLLLDIDGNSPLEVSTPGVLTQSIIGSGLHSTVVRSWGSPYQVPGSVAQASEPGGVLFDRVTFDADGDPGNGITQVHFDGTLDIGAVPPFTISRVVGSGLSFLNCSGSLRIETLNIANRGAPALQTTGTGLTLDIGSSHFETVGN